MILLFHIWFLDGICEEYRPQIWKFLFEYYSNKSTPRERATSDIERSVEYFLMKARWKQIVEVLDKTELEADCNSMQLSFDF